MSPAAEQSMWHVSALPVVALTLAATTLAQTRGLARQIVDTILSSTTRLVANRAAWEDKWKRRKIEDLALLLQGALDARRKVGVKTNLRKSCLNSVRPHLQVFG